MKITPVEIQGVFVIENGKKSDSRGYLLRTYCEETFKKAGLNTIWPQMNQTLTLKKGTVRGMHYQKKPRPEIKLVRCTRGSVWDCVLDIRIGSASYGKWVAQELSEENQKALYIPAGIAHGFQCLTDHCELQYLMSATYRPELSGGISVRDANIDINWPLPISNISARDASLPCLDDFER